MIIVSPGATSHVVFDITLKAL